MDLAGLYPQLGGGEGWNTHSCLSAMDAHGPAPQRFRFEVASKYYNSDAPRVLEKFRVDL